jgi:hypothetical protein
LTFRYPSISKSAKIPARGWDEKTEKNSRQGNGSATSGAEFWNSSSGYACHSRQAETATKTQKTIDRN